MYDVCVIGGGPAGIFSSYYASARGLQTVLLEAAPRLGGRMHYYTHMPLYDVPGIFGQTAGDYLQQLQQQLARSEAEVKLNARVQTIERVQQHFHIVTDAQVIEARTIIYAVGNGFIQNKTLPASMLPVQIAKKVRYEVTEEDWQQTGDVAVIGHTPMAIDWAIQFCERGATVTLFETEPLQLQPILMERLAALQIERQPIAALSTRQQAYDALYAHIGTVKTSVKLPARLVSTNSGETSITGIFIAGDARYEAGKVKLIHGATHDAMQAVNAANRYLHPDDHYQPIVSTHHPIFKEWSK